MKPDCSVHGRSDATALAEAINLGNQNAVGAMKASIQAAENFSSLGAITRSDDTLGLEAATAFDRLSSENLSKTSLRGNHPFGGVPSLVKDLGGPFEGFEINAGSKLFRNNSSHHDCELAVKFRAAGLCIFGVTTTPEFGLSLASEPANGPICRNPLNHNLSAGGSSGGAAAAVASGIVSIAHATDAGGSIRVPAACCGLVGLKPSRGAIPGGPHFSNHLGGIASELAVCRSVRDTAAIYNALSGNSRGPFPPLKQTNLNKDRLRVGVLLGTGNTYPTSQERIMAVEEAAKALENKGHTLVTIDWNQIEILASTSANAFANIVMVNLAGLSQKTELDFSKSEPITQAATEKGNSIKAADFWSMLSSMVHVSHELWKLFDNIDCLLMPMISKAPLPIGSFPTNHSDIDLHFERMTAFAPTASLANVSGFPAITLPFGMDQEGLPLPIQIMTVMGQDELLLSIATMLELEDRWRHSFPISGLAS